MAPESSLSSIEEALAAAGVNGESLAQTEATALDRDGQSITTASRTFLFASATK